MPWWAWLLLDLFVVLAALGVVAVAALRLYRSARAMLRRLGQLDIPSVERPIRGGAPLP